MQQWRPTLLTTLAVLVLTVSGGDAAALTSGFVAGPLGVDLGDQATPVRMEGPVDAVTATDLPGILGLDGVSKYGEGADADATNCPVVAFGDSYSWGWGTTSFDRSYPSRMERALGHPVVNAGVNGETAEEGLRRIEADVLAHDPCLVVVGFGTNEAWRGYDVGIALDGVERIVKRLHAEGIPVVIVGTHLGSYEVEYDAGLLQIAQRHDTFLVLGVLDGILSDPALRSDAFHPNDEGYALMWERLEPVARSALMQTTASSA